MRSSDGSAAAGGGLSNTTLRLRYLGLVLGIMVILTAVNLTSARSYGEFEFWFASIKVAAIVVFIVIALGWLLGAGNDASPGVRTTVSTAPR